MKQGDVVARARINIDSGEPVRAWLQAPKMQYGVKTYPVKIENGHVFVQLG